MERGEACSEVGGEAETVREGGREERSLRTLPRRREVQDRLVSARIGTE